jgi:predicted MFS family arabinose efflux permease
MQSQRQPLTRKLTWLFALTSGLVIANIYYLHPLLAVVAGEFGRSTTHLGFLVTLTQIGYACGMLLIIPLGDALNRRKMIISLLLVTGVVLLAVAGSQNFYVFAAASLALGVSSCAAQLPVPFAASLASERDRGKAVGTVMAGLLLGILLARTLSGTVAYLAGWRAVYQWAAVLIGLLAIFNGMLLPADSNSQQWAYTKLLRSMLTLLKEQPQLRLRSAFGALGYACFSLFWTGLTFMLTNAPYHYSEAKIGLFGLAGAAGALAAGFAGRMADRGNVQRATTLFSAAILVAFAFLYFGTTSLTSLLIGILVLDIGVQGVHISNQSIIYALDPGARSRITTIYLTTYFAGGAAGSAAAAMLYEASGWPGVCTAGILVSALLIGSWHCSRRFVSAPVPRIDPRC